MSVTMDGDWIAPRRRRADVSPAASRIGVLWTAEAKTAGYRVPGTVLDISTDGAKLKIDTEQLGLLRQFRLVIDYLGHMDCEPVWRDKGRLGVRFLSGNPTRAQLENILAAPPYAVVH